MNHRRHSYFSFSPGMNPGCGYGQLTVRRKRAGELLLRVALSAAVSHGTAFLPAPTGAWCGWGRAPARRRPATPLASGNARRGQRPYARPDPRSAGAPPRSPRETAPQRLVWERGAVPLLEGEARGADVDALGISQFVPCLCHAVLLVSVVRVGEVAGEIDE